MEWGRSLVETGGVKENPFVSKHVAKQVFRLRDDHAAKKKNAICTASPPSRPHSTARKASGGSEILKMQVTVVESGFTYVDRRFDEFTMAKLMEHVHLTEESVKAAIKAGYTFVWTADSSRRFRTPPLAKPERIGMVWSITPIGEKVQIFNLFIIHFH